jgi:hypothetical protein
LKYRGLSTRVGVDIYLSGTVLQVFVETYLLLCGISHQIHVLKGVLGVAAHIGLKKVKHLLESTKSVIFYFWWSM